MKTAISLLVAPLGLALMVCPTQAQSYPSVPPPAQIGQVMPYPYWYPTPCFYPAIPQAPDICGGRGYYSANCYGQPYGPNYCVHPPFPPYNGALPTPKIPIPPVKSALLPPTPPPPCGPPPSPLFTPHPYARSPRDYFMVDEPDFYYPTLPSGYGVGGSSGVGFGGAGVYIAPAIAPVQGEGKR